MHLIQLTQHKVIGLRPFAKEIGISSSTLSRVTRGGKPDLETAILICKWMKMDINKFIKKQ
jgi:transcriptional regulator with XRE-family HTH domain